MNEENVEINITQDNIQNDEYSNSNELGFEDLDAVIIGEFQKKDDGGKNNDSVKEDKDTVDSTVVDAELKIKVGQSKEQVQREETISKETVNEEQTPEKISEDDQMFDVPEGEKEMSQGAYEDYQMSHAYEGKEQVLEQAKESDQMLDVPKEKEEMSEGTVENNQMSDVPKKQEQISEGTVENNQMSDVPKKQEQISEGADENDQLSDVFKERRKMSEGTDENDQISDVSEGKEGIHDGTDEDDQMSDVLKEKGKMSEGTDENNQMSDVPKKQEQVSEGADENDQISDVSKGKGGILEGTDEDDQMSEVLKKRRKMSEGTDGNNQMSDVPKKQEQVSEGVDENDQMSDVLKERRKMSEGSDENDQISDVSKGKGGIFEGTDEDDQMSEILKKRRKMSEGTDENDQISDVSMGKGEILEGADEDVQMSDVRNEKKEALQGSNEDVQMPDVRTEKKEALQRPNEDDQISAVLRRKEGVLQKRNEDDQMSDVSNEKEEALQGPTNEDDQISDVREEKERMPGGAKEDDQISAVSRKKEGVLQGRNEDDQMSDVHKEKEQIPELTPMDEMPEVIDGDECENDNIEVIELFDDDDDDDDDNDDDDENDEVIEEEKTKIDHIVTSEDDKMFYGKECINFGCLNKCRLFLEAHQFIINFYRMPMGASNLKSKSTGYRMPRKNNKIQYVCEDCYNYAALKYETYCNTLLSHQPLLNEEIPKRHEVVEILDSSDEEDNNEVKDASDDDINDEAISFIGNNLDQVIKQISERIEINKQVSWMDDAFDKTLKEMEDEIINQSSILNELQMNGNRMYSRLYSCQKMKIKEIQPLDLNTGKSFVLESELSIPPQAELSYPPVMINQYYYAMKNKLIDSWTPCRVIEITDIPLNMKFYKVKFEKSKSPTTRCVSAKQIAYIDPPSVRLQIGIRVIALFDSTTLNNGNKMNNIMKSAFYPGIVGEPLSSYNRYRYLIFFDDGYAQYVAHKDVRLVCYASENVWDDVHVSSKEFFRCYLTQYQKNRPMVQAKKGQTITTESNGKWLPAKVIDIDASLVQMQFTGKNHTEWIYRGSTRLAPLFKERYIKKTTQTSQLPRRTEPYIRYMQDEESALSNRLQNSSNGISLSQPISTSAAAQQQSLTTLTPRAVAKKSVTKSPYAPNIMSSSFQQQQQQQQQPPVKHLNNSTIFVDDDNRPKGKVVYYTAKKNMPPRQYSPHECSPNCLFPVTYNLSSYSPLAKPLLSGWERLIYKLRGKKMVAYRAPCGRILRNMKEVHRYLRATRNVLNVDNFDFDISVHCLAEYVIERCIVQKADLSEGVENMIIPCINYYDNTMPPECTYSTERIPTEGVHLNLDSEFLVGCECTDDCSDKTKCSCWQLTLDGARFNNSNVPLDKIGYSYMRLPEPVPTGIYECNVRCKCAKNCLNRVVQHPLQMKLQVFKTSNRGWGLRCINDIPKGSFICIYAGHLLTEQNANEGGTHFGDEYFAELDYIEVVERLKEGYESDVQEDIESDDEPEEKRADDSDEEFRLHTKISTKSPSVHTRMQTRREENAKKTGGDDDDTDNPNRRKVLNFEANTTLDNTVESTPTKYKSVRKCFGKDEYCYVMDAKTTGNIGRYFNHSCSPNLFVQNVFVDTHDLRFPWVAFFALHHIKAGTELTWNYNYEVGIVPGKVLYCECGSANCRGRLL